MWNQNNPYSGYPYQQSYGYSVPSYQQPTQTQPQVSTNKMYANGIEDVRCRQLPANSDYLFLDNDKPLIYRKTTDATGKMDIQVFKITPYQEEEKPLVEYALASDLVDLKQQVEQLRDLLKTDETKPASKKTQEAKL